MIDYESGNTIVLFGENEGIDYQNDDLEENQREQYNLINSTKSMNNCISRDTNIQQFRRAGERSQYLDDLGFCLGGKSFYYCGTILWKVPILKSQF